MHCLSPPGLGACSGHPAHQAATVLPQEGGLEAGTHEGPVAACFLGVKCSDTPVTCCIGGDSTEPCLCPASLHPGAVRVPSFGCFPHLCPEPKLSFGGPQDR